MNIIILFEADKNDDGSYHLSDYRAEHIRTVLKPDLNDRLEIGILNGERGTASVQAITDDKIILADLQFIESPIQNLTIDIIVALPRPQTVKKVLFTSAMMGVRNIFFIRSNRVEKSFFHSPLLEEENYRRFLIEGLQQGKNTMLPNVSIHDKFKPFMQDWQCQFYAERKEKPLCLLPELDASRNLAEVYNNKTEKLLLAIGPEGGWVPFEIDMMTSLGFQKFKLGDWTLRVEHALTACLSQVELLK